MSRHAQLATPTTETDQGGRNGSDVESPPDVEAAVERIKQTSERVLAFSKENGLVWLEAYEKMLNGVLKLEEDTAKELSSDWVRHLCQRKPT